MERLHRSKRNKVLLGVCGGLSEYLHIDVVIIRIVCILSMFMGWGIIIYFTAALLMPSDNGYMYDERQWGPDGSSAGYSSYTDPGAGTDPNTDFGNDFYNDADNWDRPARYNTQKSKFIIGVILVGAGIMMLGRQLLPSVFELKYMLPLFFIVLGGIILYRGRRE